MFYTIGEFKCGSFVYDTRDNTYEFVSSDALKKSGISAPVRQNPKVNKYKFITLYKFIRNGNLYDKFLMRCVLFDFSINLVLVMADNGLLYSYDNYMLNREKYGYSDDVSFFVWLDFENTYSLYSYDCDMDWFSAIGIIKSTDKRGKEGVTVDRSMIGIAIPPLMVGYLIGLAESRNSKGILDALGSVIQDKIWYRDRYNQDSTPQRFSKHVGYNFQ